MGAVAQHLISPSLAKINTDPWQAAGDFMGIEGQSMGNFMGSIGNAAGNVASSVGNAVHAGIIIARNAEIKVARPLLEGTLVERAILPREAHNAQESDSASDT
jgi:hypothetical protein